LSSCQALFYHVIDPLALVERREPICGSIGFAISRSLDTIACMTMNLQIATLRLMEEMDRAIAFHKDDLGEKIAAGYTSLQEGRHYDGDAFFAELDAEDNALLNASK